jgi:FixJ family two-component response regulator
MALPLIAVVDDEKEILDNYVEYLGDDFRVLCFQTAEGLLKELPHFHKELQFLITDYKMPRINGVEMIRQAFAKGYRFPFILLSGVLDKNNVLEAVDVGAFRLMEKPISPEQLDDVIDELMIEHELKETRREVRLITGQLRELYSTLRLTWADHVPPELLKRMEVASNSPDGAAPMRFEDLLDSLEKQLERLLKTEKNLADLKFGNWRRETVAK